MLNAELYQNKIKAINTQQNYSDMHIEAHRNKYCRYFRVFCEEWNLHSYDYMLYAVILNSGIFINNSTVLDTEGVIHLDLSQYNWK